MSDHMYKCGAEKCAHVFKEPKNYNADPTERNCPKCKRAKGNVAYLGCGRQVYGIMDTLPGGVEGVLNPVDGKRYDSKSAYHRKLKETGHHVYEGEPSGKKVLNRGDHNVFNELKAAAIQHGL